MRPTPDTPVITIRSGREGAPTPADLATSYRTVRRATRRLCEPLSAEDCQVQSMPDASPAKWHLAHTTWFFETFVLEPATGGYRALPPAVPGPLQLLLPDRRPRSIRARGAAC